MTTARDRRPHGHAEETAHGGQQGEWHALKL